MKALGLAAEEVVMVGDDVVSDVGGAQKAGVRGVLVRTGKYRHASSSSGLKIAFLTFCQI